jgi:hypothetical protein
MRRRAFHLGCFLACWGVALSGFAHPAFAQQGHPLTGTWNGDWGTTPTQRSQLTVVMNWDGKEVKTVVNPGPNSAPGMVTVDVVTWMVHLEADLKDASGKAVHVVADGKLEDLGNYHRTIEGTWRQGGATGNFKLTRD